MKLNIETTGTASINVTDANGKTVLSCTKGPMTLELDMAAGLAAVAALMQQVEKISLGE